MKTYRTRNSAGQHACLAIALTCAALLAACSAAPRSAETATDAGDTAASRAPDARRPFLSFLGRGASADPMPARTESEAGGDGANEAPDPGPSISDTDIAAAGRAPDAVTGEDPAPSTRPRLFGFLSRRAPGTGVADAGPETAVAGEIVAGLPFGRVATVCGLSRREMGTEVAKSAGFRLFDTNPSGTQPRPQFITGFKDKCARQFTASLAMFGAADVHEATRYNPQNTKPYSQTDAAYETVKARVCGVGKGKPCPQRKAKRLARNAAFVSVYRGFGDNGEWLEMFLHDGRLKAFETRTN